MLEVVDGEVDQFDDANVPVNIWLLELDDDDDHYKQGFRFGLQVGNYMPRKDRVEPNALYVVSDNKQELQEIVKKHILPFYELAQRKVNAIIEGKADSFYYWNEEST